MAAAGGSNIDESQFQQDGSGGAKPPSESPPVASGTTESQSAEQRMSALEKSMGELSQNMKAITELLGKMSTVQNPPQVEPVTNQSQQSGIFGLPPPLPHATQSAWNTQQNAPQSHTQRVPPRSTGKIVRPSRTPGRVDTQSIAPALEMLARVVQQNTQAQSHTQITTFADAMASMGPLNGKEGRAEMELYFQRLEALTEGWPDDRRATLTATMLKDGARCVYDGMADDSKRSYEAVKESLINGSATAFTLRHAAQRQLMHGIKPRLGETVVEYGQRVLRVCKDATLPGTGQEFVEDMAEAHFVENLDDPIIRNVLLIQRNISGFYELLNNAAILYESSNAPTVFKRASQDQSCYECGEDWHVGQECPKLRGASRMFGQQGSRCFTPFRGTGGNRELAPSYNAPLQHRSSQHQRGVAFFTPVPQQGQREIVPNSSQQQVDLSKIAREAGPATNVFTSCTTVAGGAASTSTSTEQPDATSNADSEKHGLTRQQSNDMLISIGRPLGPSIITFVEIHGVRVETLLDPGSNPSLISMRCLGSIAKSSQLDLQTMNLHAPTAVCSAANSQVIPLECAVSLPVDKCGRKTWVEFQVPSCKIPHPIILGTNVLSLLGYQFLDPATGQDLFTEKSAHSLAVTNSRVEYRRNVQQAFEATARARQGRARGDGSAAGRPGTTAPHGYETAPPAAQPPRPHIHRRPTRHGYPPPRRQREWSRSSKKGGCDEERI